MKMQSQFVPDFFLILQNKIKHEHNTLQYFILPEQMKANALM